MKVNFMTDVLFDAEFFRRKFVYARSGNAARDNVSLSFSKLQLEIRSRLVQYLFFNIILLIQDPKSSFFKTLDMVSRMLDHPGKAPTWT